MPGPERLLDQSDRRIRREALGQHRGSLNTRVRELSAPPLVRNLVCHDRERKIGIFGTWVQQREPLLIIDGTGFGVHPDGASGMLDEPEVAERVRTEQRRVVTERGCCASDETLQILRVTGVMEDLNRHRLT
jgi:hypothetical protein